MKRLLFLLMLIPGMAWSQGNPVQRTPWTTNVASDAWDAHNALTAQGANVVGATSGENAAAFNTAWILNGATALYPATGDAYFCIENMSTNGLNSGASIGVMVMGGDDGTGKAALVDAVGATFTHVPFNRSAALVPGNAYLVFNKSAQNLRGTGAASPGLGGFDPGNQFIHYDDFINNKFDITFEQAGVYQPGDTNYTLTVAGITTAPVLGTQYTNSGTGLCYTATASSIVAGSGTINFCIPQLYGGIPAATGTLTKCNGGPGDASITYSAKAVGNIWKPAFQVDPITGTITNKGNLQVGGIINTGTTGAQITVANGFINPSGFDPANTATYSMNSGTLNISNIVVQNNGHTLSGNLSILMQSSGIGFNWDAVAGELQCGWVGTKIWRLTGATGPWEFEVPVQVDGTITAATTNSIATGATNFAALTTTGWTNPWTVDAIAYVQGTAVGMTNFDGAGNAYMTNTTLVNATLTVHMQPGAKLKSAAGLSGTAHAF